MPKWHRQEVQNTELQEIQCKTADSFGPTPLHIHAPSLFQAHAGSTVPGTSDTCLFQTCLSQSRLETPGLGIHIRTMEVLLSFLYRFPGLMSSLDLGSQWPDYGHLAELGLREQILRLSHSTSPPVPTPAMHCGWFCQVHPVLDPHYLQQTSPEPSSVTPLSWGTSWERKQGLGSRAEMWQFRQDLHSKVTSGHRRGTTCCFLPTGSGSGQVTLHPEQKGLHAPSRRKLRLLLPPICPPAAQPPI
jgi:hypothetical protein